MRRNTVFHGRALGAFSFLLPGNGLPAPKRDFLQAVIRVESCGLLDVLLNIRHMLIDLVLQDSRVVQVRHVEHFWGVVVDVVIRDRVQPKLGNGYIDQALLIEIMGNARNIQVRQVFFIHAVLEADLSVSLRVQRVVVYQRVRLSLDIGLRGGVQITGALAGKRVLRAGRRRCQPSGVASLPAVQAGARLAAAAAKKMVAQLLHFGLLRELGRDLVILPINLLVKVQVTEL